jgi:hypothetical protein
MTVDLAMRVHRRRDVAAAMHAQHNPVLGARACGAKRDNGRWNARR